MGKFSSSIPLFRHFTFNLGLATMLIAISVFNFGFDQTAYTTIQAMDPFLERFGNYNAKTKKYAFTATQLSLLNSAPRITFGLGILVGGVFGERYGRRPVYVMMLVICLVGILISYLAENYAQILAGRMINQMYIGMEGWLVPMFQAEIVPAQIRGTVVVGYVFNHVFGSFIMSIIAYHTSTFTNDMCWKIPIAVQFILPGFALLMCWFIPESPRWLVRKGRDEDALKNLRWIYGSNPEYAPEQELDLLKESLELTEIKGTWKDLVQGTNLRRLLIVIVVQAGNQLTGQAFASQYGTVFVKSLGGLNAYLWTVITNAVACIGPLANFFLIERMGRRNMYLFFGTLCMLALISMGALGTVTQTTSVKKGIAAMDMIYPLFYIMSFGGMAPVTAAEVPNVRLRDKSAIVGWSTQNITAFLVTFTVPYLIDAGYADLESKVGFIYSGFCILFLIWAWFCLPEVKGRSLEEIDEMFEAKVPTSQFKTWQSPNFDSVGARVTAMEEHAGHQTNKLYTEGKGVIVTEEGEMA